MLSYMLVAFLSVVLTLALKRAVKSKTALVVLTALVVASAFQIVVYLDLGYLDPFVFVAFGFSACLAGAVSALTLIAAARIELRKGQPPQGNS